MKIKLVNSSLLKKSIDLISGLITEGTFITRKTYLELTALNPNNVVFVNFQMLAAGFETYDVSEDEMITLNIGHINEILRRVDSNAALTLETKQGSLDVAVEGKHAKSFELSLIDYVNENLKKLPSFDFQAKISLKSSDFAEAMSDLEIVADILDLVLDVNKKQLTIKGASHDKRGAFTFTDDVEIELLSENVPPIIESKFTLEYLKKFSKGEKISGIVDLYMGHDMPLKLDYKLIDEVLISFILASRGE